MLIRLHAAAILCALAVAGLAHGQPAAPMRGFFFTVAIDLKADGSGTMRLTYPANPAMNFETERHRFGSPVTEATAVEPHDGLMQTTVAFKDVTRLAESPELSSIEAVREPTGEGRQHLRARLRSPILGEVTSREQLAITLNLPGPIEHANTDDVRGTVGVWHPPVVEFFKPEGIVIEVTYQTDTGKPSAG
jgi:hypothetical protein